MAAMKTSLVSALTFVLPVLVAVLGVPLLLDWVPPNRFYGFRTPATLASPQLWYDVNRAAGWALLIAGLLGLAGGCVIALAPNGRRHADKPSRSAGRARASWSHCSPFPVSCNLPKTRAPRRPVTSPLGRTRTCRDACHPAAIGLAGVAPIPARGCKSGGRLLPEAQLP